MSQNRTVIQGLEAADTNMGNSGNFYSRSSNSASKGTVVPGMENIQSPAGNASVQSGNDARPCNPTQSKSLSTGKPMVGFLYSVSKTPLGEFWPLHLGRNSIGKSSDADISLREGTVSENHAVIIVRQGKSGIIAAIKDAESTNGTFINGDPIDFSAEELHDGDIITIGFNYQFLFSLIDASKLGLAPSKNFVNTEADEEDNFPDVPSFGGATKMGFDSPDGFGSGTWGANNGGFKPAGGTVGLDGSISGGNHGGTVPM